MQKSGSLSRNTNTTITGFNNSKSAFHQQSLRRLGLCSQIATAGGQHSSPIVFPEKRSKKVKASSKPDDPLDKAKVVQDHRIDIIGGGDEKSDLLGCVVFSGKLILDKRKNTFHDNTSTKDAEQQSSTVVSNQEAKQASSELLSTDTPPELLFKCKSPPKMLVILNPRSGRGRSSKVFHGIVEPIFKLAGFKLEVVKTSSAGHARNLASTVDISTCPDGIICVGGDGIINEVLNGLLSRDNQKEGISIPIGIIPAGSDNSLVWTVLGVRDPVSAAISIVKGGLTATDVFAVEWIQTGVVHFGMTVSYYGFVSDVLELSEKYQKRYGPLRYFVAGFLKFLCLPKYSYEVEYLPATKADEEGKQPQREVVDMSDLYTDIMRRSNTEGMPRASSLSSIDSIMTPSRMSGGELDTTCSSTHASTEPSDYVRGLDPKSKRLSSGRSNIVAEPEVIHPQLPLSTTPNWPRTRSKSRTDKGWTGVTSSHDPSRCSWGNTVTNDREDISSTLSDPGPIWDAEPKWDTEPNWDLENPIELPGPSDDVEAGTRKEAVPRFEDKWEFKKGQYLGILVCNHACRTVQSSQVVAPGAEHDDNTMDLLLVHGSGRLRLLRFFLLLQMGRHLSLPYVEYIKVKSVKIKAGKHTHNGCGIDGELFPLNGQDKNVWP
ncbi:diacylglycerol kinase, putative [Ricinus communis]|uniref:Diacylglycerol kinase, putative n=1 Tax=Ricinus communis TaxID=3988 RepID=B9RGK9_RICCO|nr:diacylglycerol kinase, putative [Ricinus communis]